MLSGSVIVAAASWQGPDSLNTLVARYLDFKRSTKSLRLSIVDGCMGATRMILQTPLLKSGGPRCQPPQYEVPSLESSADTGRQVVVCISRHDQLATWSTGKQFAKFIWLFFLARAVTSNARLLP